MILSFFVEGEPRAKQSFRSLGRRGGYTPKHIKDWQKQVAWCAHMQMNRMVRTEQAADPDPMKGNLTVDLMFFLGNLRKIDLDNLSKAVMDGLNGIAWVDDKQVIALNIHKYVCRGNPGVLVKVKQNRRKLELSEERQKHLIGLAPYDLEPVYQGETVSA